PDHRTGPRRRFRSAIRARRSLLEPGCSRRIGDPRTHPRDHDVPEIASERFEATLHLFPGAGAQRRRPGPSKTIGSLGFWTPDLRLLRWLVRGRERLVITGFDIDQWRAIEA